MILIFMLVVGLIIGAVAAGDSEILQSYIFGWSTGFLITLVYQYVT